MKHTILISIALFIFLGCAVGSFPKFPDIKKHYMVEVKGEEFHPFVKSAITNIQQVYSVDFMALEQSKCLEFNIISTHPYKIEFVKVAPMVECHLVGGFKPDEIQFILNWIDDVYYWAKDRKHCLK